MCWQGKSKEDGAAKSCTNSQQVENLSVPSYLQPSPRGKSQGSAKRGGKEGRHQAAWPSSSEGDQHYEGDIHSQWFSTSVFVEIMHLFSSQGTSTPLTTPHREIVNWRDNLMADGQGRPKHSVLSNLCIYQHGFRTETASTERATGDRTLIKAA